MSTLLSNHRIAKSNPFAIHSELSVWQFDIFLFWLSQYCTAICYFYIFILTFCDFLPFRPNFMTFCIDFFRTNCFLIIFLFPFFTNFLIFVGFLSELVCFLNIFIISFCIWSQNNAIQCLILMQIFVSSGTPLTRTASTVWRPMASVVGKDAYADSDFMVLTYCIAHIDCFWIYLRSLVHKILCASYLNYHHSIFPKSEVTNFP